MQVTINRAQLLYAARCAASIAPGSSTIKEMTGTLLETDAASGMLTVTATNTELSLEQKLPCVSCEEDALVVNARLLAAMVEKFSGDKVELSRSGHSPQLRLVSGDTEYTVPIFEKGGFPKPVIPFPEDTVPVSGIPSMTQRTVFAASRDSKEQRPLLKCVNLMFTKDGLRATGSDGTCIITASGDSKSTGDVSLLLPALSLEKLARMCRDGDIFRVGTTGKMVTFLRENFVYCARLMGGTYIDTQRLTASIQPQFQVMTDIPVLRRGLESVLSCDPDGKIGLLFDGQRLTFHSQGTFGRAAVPVEVIPLKGTAYGESWFLPTQLECCLRALSGNVRLGIANGGMLVLETEDALYMQTAVRTPTTQAEAAAKKPMKPVA